MMGRTVNTSKGFFASVWQEYSNADQRLGFADPSIVSVELLTVVLTGPLAAYTAMLVQRNDMRYHFWLAILCTAELYGDYVRTSYLIQMTFVPEWLTGSPVCSSAYPVSIDEQSSASLLLSDGQQQVRIVT